MGTKAERRAARERVSAYHQARLAELLSHVGAAIDRYRVGEIDAYAADETIHHYHRAAAELWKLCFARGGGAHAEFIVGLLDSMTAGAETIDWWERAIPHLCCSCVGRSRPAAAPTPTSRAGDSKTGRYRQR